MPAVLSCRSLSKSYDTGAGLVEAVKDVDLDIRKGEFTAIIGPSGSGKTTLLSMLGGLEQPSSGEVLIEDEPIGRRFRDLSDYRREEVGFVFQGYNLVPHFTAIENVVLPMELAGVPRSERKGRATELLLSVGVPGERFGHRPLRLSGGEQQRVAIARALANRPPILFADEPTGNLDKKNADHVIDLLRQMANDTGLSVIVVTHNEKIAEKASRIVSLNYGRVESDSAAGAAV